MANKRKAENTPLVDNGHPHSSKQIKRSSRLFSSEIPCASERFGIIWSIELINFMCHHNLEMKLAGNVNFIIGCNGSGKSAILTGLIVGLGGKTTSTSRGSSFKNLIKSGCSSALVRVTLRLDGDEKSDRYSGHERLVVERKLRIDGSSSYKLKDVNNKTLSTKRDDIVGLLDDLNIQVDNPLTCLNQDLSKNFLHTKSESDKYKFFLKTTQLEQMTSDYQTITNHYEEIEKNIRRKEAEIPELQRHVQEKTEAFRNLATLTEMRKCINELNAELAWSYVGKHEHNLQPILQEYQSESQHVKKYDEQLEVIQREERAAKKKVDKLQEELIVYESKQNQLKPQRAEKNKELDVKKKELKNLVLEITTLARQLNDSKKDLAAIENRVRALKAQDNNQEMEEFKRKMKELESLKDKHTQMKSQIEAANNKMIAFNQSKQAARDRSDALHREIMDVQAQENEVKQAIRNLKSAQQNRLKLFGQRMPELLKKLDEAYYQGQFRELPRGPVGYYISIERAELAVPIECAVRNMLFSFIVDNSHDEKTLERLLNSTFTHGERSRISIYTSKFQTKLYDVSCNKAYHPKYQTVLDLLAIRDPVVTNTMIDVLTIESLIVIPETQEALKIMQGPNRPRNCTRAFTKDGDQVYPDRFYSNQREPTSQFLRVDVENEVRRKKEKLAGIESHRNQLNLNYNEAKSELREADSQVRTSQGQKHQLEKELNHLNVKISTLSRLEEPVQTDFRDLEDEISSYDAKIASMSNLLESKKENKCVVHGEMEQARENFKQVDQLLKKATEEMNELLGELKRDSSKFDDIKSRLSYFRKKRKDYHDKVIRLKKAVEEQEKCIAKEREKAKVVAKSRVETARTPAQIKAEHEKTLELIAVEEQRHGRRETIIREAHDAQKKYDAVLQQISWSKSFHKKVRTYMRTRNSAFVELRKMMGIQSVMDFEMLLRQRSYVGEMVFNHTKRTIRIIVDPKAQKNNKVKDLKALSGGERSFSTVCFILSLWQVMQSPMRCLDEFDVFMDMANRRVAMEMMVDMALLQPRRQFIFLTPHDISNLPNAREIHVWKMADPKRQRDGQIEAGDDED